MHFCIAVANLRDHLGTRVFGRGTVQWPELLCTEKIKRRRVELHEKPQAAWCRILRQSPSLCAGGVRACDHPWEGACVMLDEYEQMINCTFWLVFWRRWCGVKGDWLEVASLYGRLNGQCLQDCESRLLVQEPLPYLPPKAGHEDAGRLAGRQRDMHAVWPHGPCRSGGPPAPPSWAAV